MSFGTDALRFAVGLDLRPADRQLTSFIGRAKAIGSDVAGLAAGAAKVGALFGAGLTAGALAIKSITDSGSEMEAFQSRLATFMGSASEAKGRMAELFDFAASTPFQLDQVVAAEVTLRGFGAAAEEVMPGLIDFAATTGAELSQSALDIGKAWNQGAAGLESDTAKILRKQIEMRTGLDATKMSLKDFRAAMLDTLNNGMFAGGAEKLSQTFSGMVSNLEDEWSRFKMEVADAGVFNNVKGALSVALKMINENREATKRWAAIVAEDLWSAVKGVATGVAYIVDISGALASGFTLAAANAKDLVAVSIAGAAALAQAAHGQEAGIANLRRGAEEWHASANASREAAASYGMSGTALDEVAKFFTAAEEAAKGYGTAAEDAAASTGEVAGGGKGKDGPTPEQVARGKDLVAASEFYQSMQQLRETDTQAADRLLEEREIKADDFLARGLLSYDGYFAALVAMDEDHQTTLNQISTDRLLHEEEVQAKLLQMEQDRLDKQAQQRQAYSNSVIEGTQSLLGSLAGLFDQSNKKQKAAYKAFAIAQIAISTAVGIQKAFADYGWPGGIAPAALTLASGVAQGVAVAKAHQGGGPEVVYAHQGRGPDPDEQDIRRLRTEAILNSQATRALGAGGVEALNSGQGMAPAMNVITIGRTQVREIARGDVRTGGPMSRYVDERTGNSPGFSGERAVA